jgi:hypothetical protein
MEGANMNKQCTRCKQTKASKEFGKHRARKDGLCDYCKQCRKQVSRQYYLANRSTILEANARYASRNAQKLNDYKQRWASLNKAKRRLSVKQYDTRNRPRRRNHDRKRYSLEPWFRLRSLLRNRQWYLLHRSKRAGSFVRDIGCDSKFLLHHITSQFTAGMTMDNHGTVWHLDHIYPLSKADLTDRVQFLAAANWRNLRPMLGPENLEKSDAVTPEAQRLFDELVREFSQKGVA